MHGKEHMVIRGIHYCYYDEWGYRKYRNSERKEDIQEISGATLAIDGYLMDQEMIYRFIYLDDDNKILVAKCLKSSGIDLQAVFDDETNRKASGFLEGF